MPDSLPVQSVNALPVIGADQYQHIGRYAGALVLAVHEQIGGIERMAAWADANPTDFYTKLFPKLMAKSVAVDHSGSVSIDDAISRISAIDGQFKEIDDDWIDL